MTPFRQLTYVVAVADHGSIQAASKYLVSARKPLQSTISGFGFRRASVSAVGSDAATPA